MNDFMFEINNWAVLGAAVAWFILGAVWYSPALFAKPWLALIGKNPDEVMKGNPTKPMIISFVLSLIEAYILAHFVALSGAMNFAEGVQIGLWLGLGFIAIPFAIDFIYPGKSWKLYAITAGYQFLGVVLMASILAQWS